VEICRRSRGRRHHYHHDNAPLTYEVDALRDLMLVGGTSVHGILLDFVALIISLIVLVVIGAKLYPTVAR
jgi:ABC-2 type transport system permease protein